MHVNGELTNWPDLCVSVSAVEEATLWDHKQMGFSHFGRLGRAHYRIGLTPFAAPAESLLRLQRFRFIIPSSEIPIN